MADLKPKQTWILHPFGTGVYKFALGVPQCLELERKWGSIGKIAGDVMVGRIALGSGGDGNPFSPDAESSVGSPFHSAVSVPMLRDLLIQGLIGGNHGVEEGVEATVNPRRAKELVDTYGPPERPVEEAWNVAAALVYAVMMGVDPQPETAAGVVERGDDGR